MGFGTAAFIVLTCVVMGAKVLAVEYNVGDKAGWIVGPVNYTTWAASNQFHVGDTIVFSYNKQFHNVLEVTKGNFDKCTSAGPLASYNDGNTTMVLKKAGAHYYICGFPGHCVAGQKVEITVLQAASPAPNTVTLKGPALSPASAQVAVKGNANTSASTPLYHVSAAFVAALIWAFVLFGVL
ncbi:hypothetical protein KI387_018365 [Taxus chinensis]|uniref:Phytocyanin domain-containing protein n=1 Tax=Taxus chinensis TaxID=29808 RepID=A0AA38GK23_TAXCH|nr:hypothetical protein KI387_018365 [Taxus chinensis]